MAAPTQLAYRSIKGIGIFNAYPSYSALPEFNKPEGNLRCSTYSPCGRFFAWAAVDRVNVINADTGAVVSALPAQNVYELGFSPLGTYIITWQRPSKDENGEGVKNLKVWRTEESDTSTNDKETIGKFVQSSQTGWNLQYTYDERYCARVVTNEVQIYESHDLTKVWNKLRVEGVRDFAVSPGKNHSIAVFVPERKGQPAAVRVYNVPNFTAPASQKNFFKGDKVEMKWNDHGTSLIVLAQTDVDRSGKSYYGETTLYLLSANGGFDSRIDLDKEGPIHDVAWSPKSNSFAVVYGYMPAKSVIFNARAQPVFTFPLGPRNTVRFSPHGRFVFIAGFGNLAGEMDIYDMEKDYAKVCQINASDSSVYDWSPDGKHIMTATTTPRLRVDNGLRIWHAGGQLMYNEDMNELYDVHWRPQHPSLHPLEAEPLASMPDPHPSATQYMATKKTPSKPVGAYRPPGARGTATPLAFMREDKGGAAYVRDSSSPFASGVNGFGLSRSRGVPGAETVDGKGALPPGAAPGGGVSLTGEAVEGEQLSKSAKKNAKKREAKKAAAAAGKDSGSTTPEIAVKAQPTAPATRAPAPTFPPGLEPPTGPRATRSPSTGRGQPKPHPQANGLPSRPSAPTPSQKPKAMPVIPATPPAITSPTLEPDSASTNPHDKKVRGLLKKIRAIEDLKMRHAGGEALEDTQMKKISSEESVRKELSGLGYNG